MRSPWVAAIVAGALLHGPAPAPAAVPAASTRADLDRAVARGVRFLLDNRNAEKGWNSREYVLTSPGHKTAITAAAMDAVLAGAGPTPEALDAVRDAAAFLEKHSPEMGEGRLHDGFDFNGWGAAYGLRHLAGVRDRWPAGTKGPETKALVDRFLAWAKSHQRPCGGWSYLTANQDPAYAKDGSVSFMTGVMLEGIARWDAKSPLLDKGALDLEKSLDGEGRALYSHTGAWPEYPRGREESAGRSLQAAVVLAGLGKRGPAEIEARLADFLSVRGEYEKVRTSHAHADPHKIAGYYYYHAHSYAARALRLLAAKEGAPTKERTARVATLLDSLIREQDAEGAWMDAPCGDRPYATALAVLALLDLRELLFPWAGTLEAAVASAREKSLPVVVLYADASAESRKAEEALAGKDLEALRERVVWLRIAKEDAEAWKAAKVTKGGTILLLGGEAGYDPVKPATKFGPGASARLLKGKIEALLPK